MPAIGEGYYDVTTQRIPHTYRDPQREIEYVQLRPVAEACLGEDDLKPAEREMHEAKQEMHRLAESDDAA